MVYRHLSKSGKVRRTLVLSSASVMLLVAAGTPAAAQTPTSPPNVLPEIVVSPTTIPTPVERVASSVSVITRADLEREQRRTVPDALANVPGLNLVQSGGPGAQTSIFIRGPNSNHVKVLIDGIDASDPGNPNGAFNFGNLLTEDIERIEILRGPQSGLYGSDSIGGVISITTRRGEGPPKISATIEGGSFGTFNQSARLSGSQGAFDYAFNVTHFRADHVPVTPERLLPPGQLAIPDFYDNLTVSTKLGAQLSDEFRLNFVARHTDALQRFTGDDFGPPPLFLAIPAAQQSSIALKQFFTRGEAVWSLLGGRFVNYFGASHTDQTTDYRFLLSSAPSISNGERNKIDWRGVVSIAKGQTLVLGAEAEKERLKTDTVTAESGNRAVYAELQSEFAERFFLVTNIRQDDNDSFGGATTYRVAPAVLVPGTETKLKASYGTGFKAPTLNQRFVSFPDFFFFANPNLRPEDSTGWDAGFEQPFANNRIRVGATYFHNDITNLITTAFIPPFSTTLENVGSARTSGVEAFASVKITDRLSTRIDYTYTKAIDRSTGLDLLRRPREKASFAVAWSPFDNLNLSGTVLHVGEQFDSPFSRGNSNPNPVLAGYTVVNLAANYRVNDQARVFARVDNLFDKRYETPLGFQRPGLGVYAGVTLSNY